MAFIVKEPKNDANLCYCTTSVVCYQLKQEGQVPVDAKKGCSLIFNDSIYVFTTVLFISKRSGDSVHFEHLKANPYRLFSKADHCFLDL